MTVLISPVGDMAQCSHGNSDLKEKLSPQLPMASFPVLSPYHCLPPLVTRRLRHMWKVLESLEGDRSPFLHSCSQALPALPAAHKHPGTQQYIWSSTLYLIPGKSLVRTTLLRGSSDVLKKKMVHLGLRWEGHFCLRRDWPRETALRET